MLLISIAGGLSWSIVHLLKFNRLTIAINHISILRHVLMKLVS